VPTTTKAVGGVVCSSTALRGADSVDSWRFPHLLRARCGKRHESTVAVFLTTRSRQ
jgi:hypothetical protein